MGKREKKIIRGNRHKPRLSVYRSNKHIYAQVIDDSCSQTILSCSTLEEEVKSRCDKTSNKIASKIVGQIIATRILNKNIKSIIFDRGNRVYHGRIKELAEGARLVGLQF
uniref:Large ribosomal subunit protein uL18c n=1 Tax=Phaeophyceae sp. TaxID=2249243 RepID=A0A8E5BHJ0_9PHAE|nr:ribosomal protein L18 [Phaeophyceae sp.]